MGAIPGARMERATAHGISGIAMVQHLSASMRYRRRTNSHAKYREIPART